MSKRYAVFLSTLFCAFLGVFFVAEALSPDRAFSPLENRALAQMPKLSADSFAVKLPIAESGDFFTGAFMSDFETYITDQFFLRDEWIAAKAGAEWVLGKRENNGVYLGSDETLIAKFKEPEEKRVADNINYVNKLGNNVTVPVTFSIIPGKVSVWADRLPKNAPNADEQAIIARAQAGTTSVQWADVNAPLLAHKDEDLFYRTDHHWTSLGAYYGYAALGEALGYTPVPLESYEKTTVATNFYGTDFSTSGVRWIAPDSIDTYVPDVGVARASILSKPEPEQGTLYAREKLKDKDKYAMFLGGNQALGIITTAQTDAPKLLIVRDSYTDSLVPFLTKHFSEIHLIDPRYNKTPLSKYIIDEDIDQVLVLYSAANFVSDTNLFVLGK